ncbi:MAG: hypothetical protein JXR63_12410 [Spirochaetales bacterium]|nr:hypothetical protein [Spirochaetales bacterium]
MKRLLLLCCFAFIFGTAVVLAQVPDTPTDPSRLDSSTIGVTQQGSDIKEYVIDSFERLASWYPKIDYDVGLSKVKFIEGGPAANAENAGETQTGEAFEGNQYVLGVKCEYLKAYHSELYIYRVNPVQVRGVTKTISVWTLGRMYRHQMYVIVENFQGLVSELYMGDLMFQGWKKMEVAVPPAITQEDYYYPQYGGIKIIGFKVKLNPREMFRPFYIYFDDLRVNTDIFPESFIREDDIPDEW